MQQVGLVFLLTRHDDMEDAKTVIEDDPAISMKSPHIPVSVWVTLLGAYCMYAIHLSGKVFHETYLTLFGVDPNLFPRSLDEIAVLGQLVLLEKSTSIFMTIADAIGVIWWWILIGGTLYLFIIFSLVRRFPKGTLAPARMPSFSLWLKDLGKGFLLTSLIILTAVYVSACWLLMAWLPVPLGQSVGFDRYKKDIEVFKQGCKASTQHQQCVQLLKTNQLAVSEGFLIDSSNSHIAVFDVNLNQVRAIERAGTELRVIPFTSPI